MWRDYLEKNHIERIYNTYNNFADEDGFAKVVGIEEIEAAIEDAQENALLNQIL